MMTGKKVLITGATGFIGGRLAEKLILYHGANVRVLVRNFARASRIARFNVEMLGGSITDADIVDEAVAGCDTVFHCAHDFMGKNAQQNLDGARTLADACLRHGIRRFVHVSTISVYEPLSDGDVDESTPPKSTSWTYPVNKLAIENLFLQYWEKYGLPVAVIQPTIVYGPFGGYWTNNQVTMMRAFRLALPIGGLCNPVYVDDVVDSLILAAQREGVVGERFLISGAESITWREFFGAYERMLGIEFVAPMKTEEIKQIENTTMRNNGLTSNLKLLRRDPRRVAHRLKRWKPVNKLYKLAQSSMGKNFARPVSKALPAPLYVPEEQLLALYGARASVKIDKARRLLGYEPAFDLDRGMSLTAQYVKWANL
ncbi:MAG: NAD-dependent epimerase/dehydratase family protein [Pyrinomonadaceae bacterium]|jgi:nucleoside-diphosphate-sugar epimerase|nr:NAD-dependent epimerase/dehydratase family protein [Pyrinomonadaceae bacterium]